MNHVVLANLVCEAEGCQNFCKGGEVEASYKKLFLKHPSGWVKFSDLLAGEVPDGSSIPCLMQVLTFYVPDKVHPVEDQWSSDFP
jgi:hypothetical protein